MDFNPKQINFKIAGVVIRCRRILPTGRRRGPTASAFRLVVVVAGCPLQSAVYTVGDRRCSITDDRLWNSLSQHVTAAPSLLLSDHARADYLSLKVIGAGVVGKQK